MKAWLAKFKPLVTDRRMLTVFLLGISSGLPLLLTLGTMQAWCKDAGLSLTEIGLLAAVGTPYSLKFLWSPLMDWIVPPFLGRRRGWLVITQVAVIGSLFLIALTDPKATPTLFIACAILVAFTSATQDIVIDAYQIEILPREQYGLGNQFYILGYRIGMLVASSGAMILSSYVPWSVVYMTMGACMSLGLLTTLFAREPSAVAAPPRSIVEAVWHPLKDFFSKNGSLKGNAYWLLAFFILFNVGGNMASGMTTPFYKELGYSNAQIGAIAKTVGLTATIIGGLIGGICVVSFGVRRCLWLFGFLQGAGCLAFAWLGQYVGSTGAADLNALSFAISVENMAIGLATAAYATFMGTVVNRKFTATQYALLSSFMGLTRVYATVPTGFLAEKLGWSAFFVFTALAAIPGLLLIMKVAPKDRDPVDGALSPGNA